jgi:hypothetical protein
MLEGGKNVNVKRIKFTAVTLTGDTIEFDITHIDYVHTFYVKFKSKYKNKYDSIGYELNPESLTELVSVLENNQDKFNLNLGSTKQYLEKIPNSAALKKYLDEMDKLPVDEVEILK